MIASTLVVTLSLLSQAPAARAEAAPADPAASPAPGYLYSEVGNGPDVGIAPTVEDFERGLALMKSPDPAALSRLIEEKRILFQPIPVKVRVLSRRMQKVAAELSPAPIPLTRIEVLEGLNEGKSFWVLSPFVIEPKGLPASLAKLPYEARVAAFAMAQQNKPARPPVAQAGKAAEANERERLIARRRARRSSRHTAALEREEADAKVAAQARSQYAAMMPYIIQVRNQGLQAEAELERNRILNRFLNGGGLYGVIDGRAQQYQVPGP